MQVATRALHFYPDDGQPTSGSTDVYLFGRLLGDVFNQTQKDDYFEARFEEQKLEYRAGCEVVTHVAGGFFLAAFGGVEGITFSGADTFEDTGAGLPRSRVDRGGHEGPYPFFGGDVMWAPTFLGADWDEAISLGAILALTPEDGEGFGGGVWTIDLAYSMHFDLFGAGSLGKKPAESGPQEASKNDAAPTVN
jgi:hypothetical protein